MKAAKRRRPTGTVIAMSVPVVMVTGSSRLVIKYFLRKGTFYSKNNIFTSNSIIDSNVDIVKIT